MMHPRLRVVVVMLALASSMFSRIGRADVVTTDTLDSWLALVGENVTHLDFVFAGQPVPQLFTTQYSGFGVTDPQSNDAVDIGGSPDGYHLRGRPPIMGSGDPSITLDFSDPVFALALQYGGGTGRFVRLYNDGEVIAEVSLSYFSEGYGVGGLITNLPFDRAQIWGKLWLPSDPLLEARIDDLWLPTIPAPGGLAVVSLIALGLSRRRHASQRG